MTSLARWLPFRRLRRKDTRRRVIERNQWSTIVARRRRGETLSQIAMDYGVTRERIRQIVAEIAPELGSWRERTRQQRIAAIQKAAITATSIVEVSSISKLPDYVVRRLITDEDRQRVKANRQAELDSITHQKCKTCHKTKPLAEFHRSPARALGVSVHCKPCAIKIVRRYEQERFVPVPTVAEKFCTACHQVLPAACFSRMTRAKTGLQTNCKTCAARLRAGETVQAIARSVGHPHDRRECPNNPRVSA